MKGTDEGISNGKKVNVQARNSAKEHFTKCCSETNITYLDS